MVGLYFIGIIVGILVAIISNKFVFKGDPVPFVMELPNYRLPSLKSVGRLMWDKAKDFLTKAFTIIFVATIIIWALQTFDLRLNVVDNSENSLLALLGGLISPIFKPLGFADWRISTALITGFTAKESVVSTLNVLLQNGDITTLFTTAVMAFTSGETCSKVHKSHFYLDLANFIDGFNEWNSKTNKENE